MRRETTETTKDPRPETGLAGPRGRKGEEEAVGPRAPDDRTRIQRLGRFSPMVHRGRAGGRSRWIVPLAVFLVGMLVGAAVLTAVAFLVTDDRNQVVSMPAESGEVATDAAAGTAAAQPGSGQQPAAGEGGITIPQACVDAVDDAERALELFQRGMLQIRDLDGTGLQQVTDAAGRLQPVLQANVEACRAGLR